MVLPPDAPEIQRRETRLAFYGGATTIFNVITQGVSEGDEPTAADMAMMAAIQREIDEFSKTFDDEVEKRRPGSVVAAAAQMAERERAAVANEPEDAEEELLRKMVAAEAALDEMFNDQIGGPGRKYALVLLVTEFLAEGRCRYISNGPDREDIVVLFKEMIARFQGQPEMSGRA
jgi:hypothetical protein